MKNSRKIIKNLKNLLLWLESVKINDIVRDINEYKILNKNLISLIDILYHKKLNKSTIFSKRTML